MFDTKKIKNHDGRLIFTKYKNLLKSQSVKKNMTDEQLLQNL